MKVAFLDRDGTIIKDYPDEKWSSIKHPEFLEGSIDGMQKLIANGYHIIIITNQYLISDGIITLDQYQQFTQEFLSISQNNNINIWKIVRGFISKHRIIASLYRRKNKFIWFRHIIIEISIIIYRYISNGFQIPFSTYF